MKVRILIGFIFCIVVAAGVFGRSVFMTPETPAESGDPTGFSATAGPTPPAVEAFRPEIFGIPDHNFDEPPSYQMELIDLVNGNNFRKEEVIAKSGETWLGLFRENGKYFLAETRLTVVPEERPNYGYEASVTIRFDKQNEPLFLLRGAKFLKRGEVKTLLARPSSEFEDSDLLKGTFSRKFELGEEKYVFSVRNGLTNTSRNVLALVLANGQTSQIVEFSNFFENGDYIGTLLWVGDLDGDKKLDFYMDYYNFEKGGVTTGLFLSSQAESGKLVKNVAFFGTGGC